MIPLGRDQDLLLKVAAVEPLVVDEMCIRDRLYPSNVKTASYSPQTINIPAHVTRVSITIQRSRVQNFPINSFVLEMGMGNMVLRVLSVYSLLNK